MLSKMYVFGRTRAGKGEFISTAIYTYNNVTVTLSRPGAAPDTMMTSEYRLNNNQTLVDTRGLGDATNDDNKELLMVWDTINNKEIKCIVYVYRGGFNAFDLAWCRRIIKLLGSADNIIFVNNADQPDTNAASANFVATQLQLPPATIKHFTLPMFVNNDKAAYMPAVRAVIEEGITLAPKKVEFELTDEFFTVENQFSEWVNKNFHEDTSVVQEYEEDEIYTEQEPVFANEAIYGEKSTPYERTCSDHCHGTWSGGFFGQGWTCCGRGKGCFTYNGPCNAHKHTDFLKERVVIGYQEVLKEYRSVQKTRRVKKSRTVTERRHFRHQTRDVFRIRIDSVRAYMGEETKDKTFINMQIVP